MKSHDDILKDAEVARRGSVQLDCTQFRRTDPLTLWKNRLIVGGGAAMIVLGLWWWIGGRLQGGNSPAFSPGEVAFAHAAWETQCNVCHEPNAGSRSGWGAQTFGVSHTPDAKCNACHSQETEPGGGEFKTYAPHHTNADVALTPTCAACHLDHQGRTNDLTRVADRFCTTCHASLAGDAHVADWSSHPPSRSLAKDPGNLKFNHQLHMRAGLGRIDGSILKTWDQLDAGSRARLGGNESDGKAPVQLVCASCHDTEADPAFKDVIPPSRASGSMMLPVNYERHCKVCHPITVAQPGDPAGPIDIPHGWEPARLHKLLDGLIMHRLLERKQVDRRNPPWLLPGKDGTIKQEIQDEIARIGKQMTGGKYCGECHQFKSSAGDDSFAKAILEPTNVPDLWMPHARFNHAAHKMLDCVGCHADMTKSTDHTTVGIPNLDNCKQCHGPTSTSGGVRSTCVTCHTYHNGDHPRQGMGARSRMPRPGKVDIEKFLRPGE